MYIKKDSILLMISSGRLMAFMRQIMHRVTGQKNIPLSFFVSISTRLSMPGLPIMVREFLRWQQVQGRHYTAIGALQRITKTREKTGNNYLFSVSASYYTMGTEYPSRWVLIYLLSMRAAWIPSGRINVPKKSLIIVLGKLPHFIILATHDTISSDKFIEIMEDHQISGSSYCG